MKKIFLTSALLFALSPFTLAGIIEGTTTDNDFLLKTNYSRSTARIVDTIRSQNNYDVDYEYRRVYPGAYPRNALEFSPVFYKRLRAWFDPMADDMMFGEHEINFNNKLLQMEPGIKDYFEDARTMKEFW